MNNSRNGFTIIETLVAATLAVVFIASGATAFMYILKHESLSSAQAELDIEVRLAAERLKRQMRLSALNEMVFYPQEPVGSPPSHISVGFPLPGEPGPEGMVQLTGKGRVEWGKTVIIHPYPPHREGTRELRITTFEPRDHTLTDAQRFQQIEDVTINGEATGQTYNHTNANTMVVFRNLFDWGIRPLEAIYDGYAPNKRRDSKVTLGSVVVKPGMNTMTLTTVGADPRVEENKMFARLDTLMLTPSYLDREAENLDLVTHNGPMPYKNYEANAIYSANHLLKFPAAETDQWFMLEFENDCWEKVTFRQLGDLHRQTDVIFDDTVYPRRYALTLAGMTRTWEATTQTGTNNPAIGPNLHNHAMRILMRGHDMEDSGFASINAAGCRVRLQAPNALWWWVFPQGLRVEQAFIAESADHEDPSPDINPATLLPVTFNDGNLSVSMNYIHGHAGPLIVESDVIPMEIKPEKSYVVSLSIVRSGDNRLTTPHRWVSKTAHPSTYLYQGGGIDALTLANWSDIEEITESADVFLIESLFGTYAPQGVFESFIADTRMPDPEYQQVEWEAIIPNDTSMELKLRSGNQPDLSDAPAWSNVTAEALSPSFLPNLGHKRYVQFRVEMTANEDGTLTPRFERFKLLWDGPEQIVDIGGAFSRAPDSGRFKVKINDQELKTGVIVDLDLYRDIRGFMLQGHQRLNSEIFIEVTPRNTKWDPD